MNVACRGGVASNIDLSQSHRNEITKIFVHNPAKLCTFRLRSVRSRYDQSASMVAEPLVIDAFAKLLLYAYAVRSR